MRSYLATGACYTTHDRELRLRASDDEDATQPDREGWATNANKYPVGRDGELKVGDRISVDADDMVCENVEIIEIKAVRTIEYVRSARAHALDARALIMSHILRARAGDERAVQRRPW